jgi:ribokinase
MADIVVVGSLNMDLVVKTEHMPASGETVHGEGLKTIPGGKGANQAASAAKLGSAVAMVGKVGGDDFGLPLIDNLQHQGVDTAFVKVDREASTGTAVIIVDSSGQNSIVVSLGANGRVTKADIDACEDVIKEAKILLLQFEIPLDSVVYAMQIARRHGVQVILNPAPAKQASLALLKSADILVPNEMELQLLTNMPITDEVVAEEAAKKLLAQGVKVVIVTLGERGALLLTGERTIFVPAKKVKAVDTTAAGDAFIGGLATGLLKGFDLEKAVRYGCAAGTLAVTKFGAQTSLPSAREVEKFISGE